MQQTRPDLAAGTSLAVRKDPSVTNLIEVNKLLKEAMVSKDWKLRFVPIDLITARLLAFSDASWANAEDLKSQAGYLTFIVGPEVFSIDGDKANLVDWKSHRIRRRCRSTLAAETMSLDAAADATMFARELLAELLFEDYRPTQSGRLDPSILPASMATDCRSLYDLVVKDGPLASTQEKRLTLDIGALREAAEELEPSGGIHEGGVPLVPNRCAASGPPHEAQAAPRATRHLGPEPPGAEGRGEGGQGAL